MQVIYWRYLSILNQTRYCPACGCCAPAASHVHDFKSRKEFGQICLGVWTRSAIMQRIRTQIQSWTNNKKIDGEIQDVVASRENIHKEGMSSEHSTSSNKRGHESSNSSIDFRNLHQSLPAIQGCLGHPVGLLIPAVTIHRQLPPGEEHGNLDVHYDGSKVELSSVCRCAIERSLSFTTSVGWGCSCPF